MAAFLLKTVVFFVVVVLNLFLLFVVYVLAKSFINQRANAKPQFDASFFAEEDDYIDFVNNERPNSNQSARNNTRFSYEQSEPSSSHTSYKQTSRTTEKKYYSYNSTPSYFVTLGFSTVPSTFNEVKVKYRQLIKMYHPDLNNNSEESNKKTMELNEAFEKASEYYNKR